MTSATKTAAFKENVTKSSYVFKPADIEKEFAELLIDDESIQYYFDEVIKDDDQDELIRALYRIAKAKNIKPTAGNIAKLKISLSTKVG
jgi:hypothetical protein